MNTEPRNGMMNERTRYPRANPAAYRAMKAMQDYVDGTGLEHGLRSW